MDGKALSNHTDDMDVVYQSNMRRLTTTLADLLGAMNKGGKDGKGACHARSSATAAGI